MAAGRYFATCTTLGESAARCWNISVITTMALTPPPHLFRAFFAAVTAKGLAVDRAGRRRATSWHGASERRRAYGGLGGMSDGRRRIAFAWR